MATLYEIWQYPHQFDFKIGVQLLEAYAPKALSQSVMSQLQMFAATGKEPTEYLKGKLEYALANIRQEDQNDSPPPIPIPNTDISFHTGEVAEPISEAEIERRPIPDHIKLFHKEHAHHHALMVAADNDQDRGYHASKIMTDIIPALDQYYDSVRDGITPEGPTEPTKQAPSDSDVRKLFSLRARISKLKNLIKQAKTQADRARYEQELEGKQAQVKLIKKMLDKATDITPEDLKWLRIKESLKGMSDTDIVSRWYLATDQEDWKLTERQDAMRQRMDFAKAQFLKRKKYNDIREALMGQFGVSIAQAQIDIRRAMNLFGDIDRIPKEAHRQRTIQMALDAFEVAKEAKDAYGMSKATEVYAKAAGLDKDDTDRIDIEKMMAQRTYVEVLDPKLREMLLNFMRLSGGSIDVTKLFNHISAVPDGEYVEYEAAPPDDAGADPEGD